VSIPKQPWRSPLPPLSAIPPPQTIFGHFIRNFVRFYMRVFGEFWKLTVKNNDTKNKKIYINGVGKAHCFSNFQTFIMKCGKRTKTLKVQ